MVELEPDPGPVAFHSALSFPDGDLKPQARKVTGFNFFTHVYDLILTLGHLSVFLIPWEYREKGPGFST